VGKTDKVEKSVMWGRHGARPSDHHQKEASFSSFARPCKAGDAVGCEQGFRFHPNPYDFSPRSDLNLKKKLISSSASSFLVSRLPFATISYQKLAQTNPSFKSWEMGHFLAG
jgi:hypothetical protein